MDSRKRAAICLLLVVKRKKKKRKRWGEGMAPLISVTVFSSRHLFVAFFVPFFVVFVVVVLFADSATNSYEELNHSHVMTMIKHNLVLCWLAFCLFSWLKIFSLCKLNSYSELGYVQASFIFSLLASNDLLFSNDVNIRMMQRVSCYKWWWNHSINRVSLSWIMFQRQEIFGNQFSAFEIFLK